MKIIKEKRIVENNVKPVKDLIYSFNDGLTRIKKVIDLFEKETLHITDVDIGNSFEKLSFRGVEVKLIFKEDLFEALEQSDFDRLKKTIKSNFDINIETVEESNEMIINIL